MAEFLNIPYSDIVIAAAVPSILFYAALLLQVDCHAAVHGLKGQPAEEIPSLTATLKAGLVLSAQSGCSWSTSWFSRG